MCRQCCIALSGCSAPGHQFRKLSVKQQQKINPVVNSDRWYMPLAASPSTLSPSTPSPSTRALASPSITSLLTQPPIVPFLNSEARRQQDEVQDGMLAELEHDEEYDYQVAVAASLDHQYTTPNPPTILSSMLTSPLPTLQQPISSTTKVMSTGSISKHLNADWSRPYQDNSAKKRIVTRPNNDHRFRVIFWSEVR